MSLCPTDADADSDDDDEKGLFDESDDDEPQKPLSKREKLEALQAKKRQEQGGRKDERASKESAGEGTDGGKVDGYGSEDSYQSAQFYRTKEDNDFIDMDDDDPDAINELYSEQHFDDERPMDEDEEEQKGRKKGGKSSSSSRKRGPDALSDDDNANDNPIMAVVNKMKRKKRATKNLTELEDEAKEFVTMMERAADDDEQAVRAKRPATRKLANLQTAVDTLARRDLMRPLLDANVLVACKRWIQPLPGGKLGNVTVRQRLISAVGNMTGENGISSHDLRQSGIGHTVMTLYKHKSETPTMKRELKKLIEQWSRPIFQKSGNMKDLEQAHAGRRNAAMVQMQSRQMHTSVNKPVVRRGTKELQSMIVSGKRGKQKEGMSRVRVPFSQGFQFTVRPQARTGNVADKRMVRAGDQKDNRGNLSKRMIEKGRAVAKNQRSANLSVEGRPTK